MKFLVGFILLTTSLWGADASGKWKGTADAGNGPIERTFTFKVDGTKLSGDTESQMMGKSELVEGKIDGDKITFSIKANFQGNEMTLTYKGTVTADGIKLSSEFPGGGQTIEWSLKKQ